MTKKKKKSRLWVYLNFNTGKIIQKNDISNIRALRIGKRLRERYFLNQKIIPSSQNCPHKWLLLYEVYLI